MKRLLCLALAIVFCFFCTACAETETNNESSKPQEYSKYVKVTMKDFGVFYVELDYENAPITAANFMDLVNSGFYDGLTIHRLYMGLIIQGGDPNGNGTGGPGYTIKGEFAANGVNNQISHTRGTISMARTNDYDSAGSQFFVMLQDNTGWDGLYAGFGKVVKGMEVVDAVGAVEYDSMSGRPVSVITIEKMEAVESID